jgi:hypothetical protein
MGTREKLFNNCIVLMLAVIILAGCAKETTTSISTTSNSISQSSIAADDVTINNEMDHFIDDAITVLCNPYATLPNAYGYPIDSVSPGVIEILYNQKPQPDGKIYKGGDSIHFNPSVSWGTKGATASITFGYANAGSEYEVTFGSSSSSAALRFEGTITITNVSGGLLQNLTSSDSLVIKIQDDATVGYTFNENVATIVYYTLKINQIRSFTKPAGNLYATTRGDTNVGGFTNVSNWGLDNNGDSYFASITSAVVQNISNTTLSYNPLNGAKDIQAIAEPILCTYGVNQQGVPISSGTPYGFNITWYNNGGQAQNVIPYYY